MNTPNLKAYGEAASSLLGLMTNSKALHLDFFYASWVMEMWWDGMDGSEREQARRFNELVVEKLKKDGGPVPGIFRTIGTKSRGQS